MIRSIVVVTADTGDVIAGMNYGADCADSASSAPDHFDVDELRVNPKSLGWTTSTNCDPVSGLQKNGIRYYRIERDGLYFVATSTTETSASENDGKKLSTFTAIEILSKLHEVCRDLCGTSAVTEDWLRNNAGLVNELLLEFMNQGVVQLSSSEKLKPHIYSEPIRSATTTTVKTMPDKSSMTRSPASRAGSQTSIKSTIFGVACTDTRNRNEVFLDVVERVGVTVAKDGTVLRSSVDGRLVVKCYVRGSPLIKLSLNNDLAVDACSSTAAGEQHEYQVTRIPGGNVRLDSCRFHQTVSLENFGTGKRRTLTLTPPTFTDFTLLTYRIESRPLATLPFRLRHTVTAVSQSTDLDVELLLKCQVPVPASALYVTGRLSIPRTTTSLMSQLDAAVASQSTHFDTASSTVCWNIRRFEGGTQITARLRLVDGNLNPDASRLELGPLALEFELSTYACSGLSVDSLDVVHSPSESSDSPDVIVEPSRWVRYISHANSYVFRLR